MRSQFEEKTYEQYLTSELVHGRREFFPPGQVLEEIVGFDVSLRTSSQSFWRLFPHLSPFWHRILRRYPAGIELSPEWWHELEEDIQRLAPFKFNCFIQAKRPDCMVRPDAAEYSCWNCPYFRYDTFASQQRALVTLAERTLGKAAVVYACPAFRTCHELWEAKRSAQLVSRSNFCEVLKLNGHSRFSFTTSGNTGFAHSHPVPVESTAFEDLLDLLQNQEPSESNIAFLANTSEHLTNAADDLDDLRRAFSLIRDSLFQDFGSQLATSLATIYAFQLVCSVTMLIGCEG